MKWFLLIIATLAAFLLYDIVTNPDLYKITGDMVQVESVQLEPNLTVRFVNDVCHGIYISEKDRGMNSTVWVCESGFIGYDPTGTVFPDPTAPIPSNFNGE